MKSVLIRQANHSNVQPLIKVIEHTGHQPVVVNGGEEGELPEGKQFQVILFSGYAPSKTQEFEKLQAMHEQHPGAKIIALLQSSEGDESAMHQWAGQPGIYRVVKNPFNAGKLMDIVKQLVPLDSK